MTEKEEKLKVPKAKKEKKITEKVIENTNIKRASAVPASKDAKVDRYGWIVDCGEAPSKEELKMRREETILEEKKIKTWQKYVDDWAELSGRKRWKIQDLVMEGIPDAYRERIWKYLLEPRFLDGDFYEYEDMDKLISRGSTDAWTTIEADLIRTMPHCPMFNTEDKIESLRRVLYAYSNKDRELDYTQGMSFFAGFLLMYMDERDAFQCFEQLMLGKKHEWRNYFLQGFPRLIQLNSVWECVLSEEYPKVAKHINDIQVPSLVYTPSWFLTAFLNIDFPIVVRLQILDAFFEFGTRALLSFALAIISRHKKELATQPAEKVMTILQKPHSTPNTRDWRYLIKKFHQKFIPIKKYYEYFEKAGVAPFP